MGVVTLKAAHAVTGDSFEKDCESPARNRVSTRKSNKPVGGCHMNIIIGTAILWGLSALLVVPLARFWLGRKLEEPAYARLQGAELSESDQSTVNSLATRYYIMADVLVLGTAGLIGGLLGYWFIGLSFETKGWPGMIAFIGASFLGVSMARP